MIASSIDEIIASALRCGVAVVDFDDPNKDDFCRHVQVIANRLGAAYTGRLGATIEYLTPKQRLEATPNSLSSRYGTDRFPWHTDTAHRLIPARWIVMGCVSPGSEQTRTELLPWSSVTLSVEMAQACLVKPFAIANGGKSFMSTILQTNREFIRFDPGCMRPLDQEGFAILSELADWPAGEGASVLIDWHVGRVVIFDNWNYLHRRNRVSGRADRMLVRAYAA